MIYSLWLICAMMLYSWHSCTSNCFNLLFQWFCYIICMIFVYGVRLLYSKSTILRQHHNVTRTKWRHVPTDEVPSLRFSRWHRLRLGSPEAYHPHWHADYTQYCKSTWIGTPNSPAKFDPAWWNQHDSAPAGLLRSSNIAKGWHLGFKSLVCPNPTLWTFLDAL